MRAAAVAILVLLLAIARADDAPAFVVIVNSKNPVTRLDKKWLADAFLKKRTQWSDESVIKPVDQKKTAKVRVEFSRRILDRSVASVRTYWNQLVFSGRGVPPPEADSDAAVVAYVAKHAGAIGYVTAAAKLEGVRVIEVR